MIIEVVMHEHKWGTVPDEPLYRSCECGFFRRRLTDGTLVEPDRHEILELIARVDKRLDLRVREKARQAGLFVPKGEIEKGY